MSSDCGSTVYTKKASYLKYGDHATGLVSDLTYRIGEKSVDREKYSYDAEGNISAIHENGKLKVRYTYDSLNRLIREDNKDLGLTTTFIPRNFLLNCSEKRTFIDILNTFCFKEIV